MMWLYLLIITIAVTGFFAAAMGLKLIFEKDASVDGPSCGAEPFTTEGNPACSHCNITGIANCDE
jgi:hypothetical protein